MSVVAQAKRLVELWRLGLSEALIRLFGGERLHALFDYRCQGPPFYCYQGAACPDGPVLLPLWDSDDSVTAVWVRERRLEFMKFSVEAPAEHVVLARTEQGLWASVFVDLYEDRDDLLVEDFREAARVVGFRFLDWLVDAYESADVSTVDAHATFVRELVRRIDGEANDT
jgi:hypothetical protein